MGATNINEDRKEKVPIRELSGLQSFSGHKWEIAVRRQYWEIAVRRQYSELEGQRRSVRLPAPSLSLLHANDKSLSWGSLPRQLKS